MKFVEEIAVEEFIPTVRSLLAERLQADGLTQHEIAGAIGVSQSAVSKYVHGEVRRHPRIAADDRVNALVDDMATGLANASLDRTAVLIELEILIRELEAPGDILARLHEEAVPGLQEYDEAFRVHDPESRVRQRAQIRASVKRAISLLTANPQFVELLPQVGTNVVEIVPDGQTGDDVVGVPGRIIDVEGNVSIPAEPEFGVSGHLARILLSARAAGSQRRGAVNICYRPALVEALRDAGHTVVEIPGDGNLETEIESVLQDAPDSDVIAQTGGFGIEPIIYVFGADAPEAVKTVLGLQ